MICAPEDFNAVRDALEERFGPASSARLAWRPQTTSPIDEETATSLFKLLETLEDSDDVQNVYANFEVGRRRDGAARRLTTTVGPCTGWARRCAFWGSIPGCGTPAGESSRSPATA